MSKRAETGPMRFEDDWTGYFLRGDSALFYANAINDLLEAVSGVSTVLMSRCALLALKQDLYQVYKQKDKYSQTQEMKKFEKCKRKSR